MKKIIIFLGFIILILLIALLFIPSKSKNFSGYKTTKMQTSSGSLTLYIADTDVKREQGLSNIKLLPIDHGMIFIFNRPETYSFWMKDMHFALDFIYINNNKIVDLKENISPESYPSTFEPSASFDKVIEVNSGIVKKLNFHKGEEISFQN